MPFMYCEKCGAENSATAKFCRKCGAVVEVEEETRVAARHGDAVSEYQPPFFQDAGPIEYFGDGNRENHPVGETPQPLLRKERSENVETAIFSISPTLLFVKIGYAAAAVGALFLVAIVSVLLGSFIPTSVAVLFGLMLFLIPAFYHFRQKLVRYTLTDSKLQIDTGFISRTTRNVPIRRIQDVTVSANVVQLLPGFGDIVIDNASDLGGKAVMKNINTPKHYADVLLKQMRDIER